MYGLREGKPIIRQTMRSLWNSNFIKWFYFGMHIKRWLLLVMIGVTLMGLGFGYALRELYFSYTFPEWVGDATLQFLPRLVRAALFMLVASGIILFGVWKLNTSLLAAFVHPSGDDSIVDAIYRFRYQARGPKIVAVGGGTGLPVLLRGLKEHSSNLTAIVTVGDDGGSSGILRRELGVLPPGDVRNCIAALAEAEPLMTRLFQYRFNEGSGLEGHSFGNLFIVAMSGITGNFEEAVRETSRVLAVRGQILPSSLSHVTVHARTEDEEMIDGEHNITERGSRISEISLQPANVQANPEAIRAILEADIVVCGPGSLMTSVLPNLLVDGIRQAMAISQATKIYVCNVATQHGETDDFAVSDHFQTLVQHIGPGLFDYVLANDNVAGPLPEAWMSQPVVPDSPTADGARVVTADVISEGNRYHHDSTKLAAAVMRLYAMKRSEPPPEPRTADLAAAASAR
ncbi:MAG: uridine diphosphate-N-acetylglucosamine-binding protein YvcK [Dehalococcoidia bacterium]|nr:uridine diphosphate-N-acetylglucosamine-binding protein YvcK [Dehalococcoidia bacterium]